jgi:hypothetical protein
VSHDAQELAPGQTLARSGLGQADADPQLAAPR